MMISKFAIRLALAVMFSLSIFNCGEVDGALDDEISAAETIETTSQAAIGDHWDTCIPYAGAEGKCIPASSCPRYCNWMLVNACKGDNSWGCCVCPH
jgi:hypothetical protein